MPIWGDITKVSDGDYKEIKSKMPGPIIVSGGFPCQPWSNAGEGKGTEDDRELTDEMLRGIKALMPFAIVAENVSGIVSEKNIHHIEYISRYLESIGYNKPLLFEASASAYGLPSMERHAWIITTHSKKFKPTNI